MGIRALISAAVAVLLSVTGGRAVDTLHLVVMAPTDPKLEAPRYEALSAYLRSVNPLLGDIKLRIAKDCPEAARLFADGDVEGMFSGSFAAAAFIARGVVRPVKVFAPDRFPGVALVGSAVPGNPNNTFIIPPNVHGRLGDLISRALLGLGADTSEKAIAAKRNFGCAGFITTAGMDFAPTFQLLKKAGVEPKTFDFLF